MGVSLLPFSVRCHRRCGVALAVHQDPESVPHLCPGGTLLWIVLLLVDLATSEFGANAPISKFNHAFFVTGGKLGNLRPILPNPDFLASFIFGELDTTF